jgi:C4-dicarboxylate-specific signal transduction histidine kinase
MESKAVSTTPKKDPLIQLAHQLKKREKALDCLFGFSEIIERAGGSLEIILRRTVEMLPAAWTHAEIACARIALGDEEFRSERYGEPVSTQAAGLFIGEKESGIIEISYLEPRPPLDEGPFTEEERKLLDSIAERMGHVVQWLSAEERVRRKEEDLRERMTHFARVSTMGELASSIAHEVNQPLTAIATYAQGCRRMVEGGRADATELAAALEQINEEALRAGAIVHRLRGLAKRHHREPVECDLGKLLEELLPLAALDARMNDVDLKFRIPSESLVILADAVHIQQVVLNLIRNGIDAMTDTPRERRTLEVRVALPDEDGVTVSVADQGCGLPEVSDESLFEPFFTTKETGLGLGLNISRSILAAHGSRLGFSRNPEGGTTFYFTLPLKRVTNHE